MHTVIPEPSPQLFTRVIDGIQRAERRRARVHRGVLFSLTLSAFVGSTASLIAVAPEEFAESALRDVLSLLSSDTMVLGAFWDTYALALLESLPALTIAAALAALMSIVGLARMTMGFFIGAAPRPLSHHA
ncbi:hypothetical protein HY629_01435 [Candidatus Uhrbacteria bacterium]|nr:hypothetical protein [Candidatus Uhrbacteria bacterium]